MGINNVTKSDKIKDVVEDVIQKGTLDKKYETNHTRDDQAKHVKNIEDITNINNVTNIDKIKNQIKYLKWKTNGKQENKTYTDSVDLLNIEDITNINNITNIDNIKKLIEKLISKTSDEKEVSNKDSVDIEY